MVGGSRVNPFGLWVAVFWVGVVLLVSLVNKCLLKFGEFSVLVIMEFSSLFLYWGV